MGTQTKSRKKSKDKKKQKGKLKKGWRSAKTSDRHELYELSVQEPDSEIELIYQVWKEKHTRTPRTIREDFCGTAAVAISWAKHHKDNQAWCVDLDAEVLDWSRQRMESRLSTEQRSRVHLIEGDVRSTNTPKVDTVLAMNFSYFLFKTRDELRSYFKTVYSHLVKDGMFLLDAYGGSDSFLEMEEDRQLDGFTYIWDQDHYNPITGDVINHIHFKFPDGTQMKKAFSYEWRLWTLPEIRELLIEAGFKDVAVYWEGTDEETEEGNGEFSETTDGDACEGWIAYLVARK